MVGQVA